MDCSAKTYYFNTTDTDKFLSTLPSPSNDEGIICTFRRSLFEGSAVSPFLYINNVKVYDIKNGSYYCGHFPFGKVSISAEGIVGTGVSTLARLEENDILIYEISMITSQYLFNEVDTQYGLSQMLGIKKEQEELVSNFP